MSAENAEAKPRKIRKASLIAYLALAIVAGLWWGVPTYRKARADTQVRELCAKDGRITIYETVKLPANSFDEFGEVRVPHEQYRQPSDQFFYTSDDSWIIPEGDSITKLVIWRGHFKLFRARDNKLLGEATYYARRGGDPIGPWHISSFLCPEKSSVKYLAQRIFVKQ